MLTIENAHAPILVSVGDTLDREPTHICEKIEQSWSAGAVREKHLDQSTSGVHARRREDASKSAAHKS